MMNQKCSTPHTFPSLNFGLVIDGLLNMRLFRAHVVLIYMVYGTYESHDSLSNRASVLELDTYVMDKTLFTCMMYQTYYFNAYICGKLFRILYLKLLNWWR